ncbi:MAG: tRNA lysidine(34) synthetase TilS [Gammaproteobacteria bacterium]|nr:tRNA lysidine(34) synthetase TilS [Gammaproteobacteria bacterium]
MFSLKTLFSLIDQRNFIIAYSGGVDSHVLLHTFSELKKQNSDMAIQAVHVNHQLNPLSNNWALHCEKTCNALNIPITIEKITIDLKPGDSLEEKAREARYAILQKHIYKNSVLLTAHNANDQAETFLLQALRGAGPKGLSAMPLRKKFGDSFLIRPLLNASRDEIEKYALENNLKWIEDDSNIDTKFNRNYLRHEIFPILKKRFPAVMENFSRSSRLIANHENIISELIEKEFEMVKTDDIQKIDLKKLLEFPSEKQKLLLRQWFQKFKKMY